MIVYRIPQSAVFLTPTVQFVAPFNAVPGVYNFAQAAQLVAVLPLVINTTYLISQVSIGCDIPEEEYLGAINAVPQLVLSRALMPSAVYARPYALPTYSDGRDATAFVKSDQDRDVLLASVSGVLNQTAFLVGRATVRMILGFTIYACSEREYDRLWRGESTIGPV